MLASGSGPQLCHFQMGGAGKNHSKTDFELKGSVGLLLFSVCMHVKVWRF